MAPKKAGVKMSMAELGEKFGGDIGANLLPTHSEGKDFGKSKGKGFQRDFGDDRSDMHDWRSGKGEGKSRFGRDRDQGPSRSDQGDWLTKEPVRGGRDRDDRDRDGGGGFRGGGGRGGFDRDRRGDDGEAEKDSDWRSGGRRLGGRDGGDDRDDGPRRGGNFGGRNRDDDAGGGWRRDRDRGGDDAPSSRPRLNLLPRSKPVPDREAAPDTERNRDDDDDKHKARSNPFGAAKPAPAKPAARDDDSRRGPAAESRPVEPPWKAGKSRAPVAEETGTEDDAEEGGDGEWEVPKKTAARGKKEVVPTKVVARPTPAAKDSDDGEEEEDDDDDDEEEQDKDEEEDDDDEDEEEGKGKKIPPEKNNIQSKVGQGAKWVPPSLAKRQKEQEKERAKQEEEERKKEEEKRQREEDRRQKAELESRRRKEEEDRKASTKATPRTAGGGYVPPGKQKEIDARRKKEEEEDRKAREAEEKKKQQEEQRREREKAAKLEAKERKEAETKAKKEALKHSKPGKPASGQAPAVISEDRLSKFVGKCENLVDDDGDMEEDAVDEAISVLTQAELQNILPTRRLVTSLMRHCRGKSEEWVMNLVERFSPILSALIEKSEQHRFKVQVLCEAQRAAHEMGLPRLSPSAALIEAFFDALYRAEIIEEQYFEWWALADDETPGKNNAMFQINPFLDWLRTAPVEGEEKEEEEEKEGDEDEDEEDEDEEYEIDPIGIKSRR